MQCLLAMLAMTWAAPAAGGTPPNILLIYVDNVGYGDLGCYGNRDVQTPRIDRLAREGVRCTDFYVVTSSCTPSRGALLTGRYPARNGLAHQLSPAENFRGIGLPQREQIIPQYLKPAGYTTACFGKWNIGFAPGSRPTERGFDEFLGFRAGNIDYFTHIYCGQYDLFRQTEPSAVQGYSTFVFADAAADFIRRHSAGPWFVYLPFNAAHYVSRRNVGPGVKPAWEAPADCLRRYGRPANEPDAKIRYRAVLTALDDGVGRVVDALEALRLVERTLVILISDNGAFMLPEYGLGVASNGVLRGGGTTAYEGGVRVPCIVRWPGQIPAGTVCRESLSHLDILPLCLAAAGLRSKGERILDGRNPLPTLSSRASSPHERIAFAFHQTSGLRAGNYKVVRSAPQQAWELYDLAGDPGESRDLAAQKPDRVASLDALFHRWENDVRDDASPRSPLPLRTMQYLGGEAKEAAAWQGKVRSKLFGLLKMSDLVERTKPLPLAPQTLSSTQEKQYELREVGFQSTPGRRIKAILTIPAHATTPCPAVVCIHGHSATRRTVYDPKSAYRGFAQALAERGYVTIAVDVGQHKLYEPNRTLMGERLWDLMRCVDYLESLPTVDRRRIGCGGLSLGGEMTMWLAAMDPRIAAAVSSGFLTRMDQMEQRHCMCWKFEGLRELVDYSDIYSLTAPRPLLCQNGLKEPATGFTVPLAAEALRDISLIYADLGQPQNATLLAHGEGHVIHLPSLVAFFDEHLRRQ